MAGLGRAGRRHLRGRDPAGSHCGPGQPAPPRRGRAALAAGRGQGPAGPSVDAHTEVTIETLQIAGDPDRVRDWLGLPADSTSSVIDFEFVSPHGTPGLMAVTFETAAGEVTI